MLSGLFMGGNLRLFFPALCCIPGLTVTGYGVAEELRLRPFRD